jgi:hypothetical protein
MLSAFLIILVDLYMLLKEYYVKAEPNSLGTDEAPSWFQKFEIENKQRWIENNVRFSELQAHIDMRFEQLHDDNRDKIISLQKASRSSEICGSAITSHFVLYKSYVFAISVAHTPCYMGDILPEWFHVCPQLDVSIWSGCPPANVALLNITSSVVDAEMGDAATAFGFSLETLEPGMAQSSDYLERTLPESISHQMRSKVTKSCCFREHNNKVCPAEVCSTDEDI